ncbi:Proteinase inhibitor-like protein [Drosera capensis]
MEPYQRSCGDGPCPGKTEWPELLGARGEEAVHTIEKENQQVRAIIVCPGFVVTVTDDCWCTRVWVWVDENGLVIHIPHVWVTIFTGIAYHDLLRLPSNCNVMRINHDDDILYRSYDIVRALRVL